MIRVGILNYGLNNLNSLAAAFERLCVDYQIIDKADEFSERTSHLILPGVGSFPAGMRALRDREFDKLLSHFKASYRPILGICLGMQLLSRGSDEEVPTDGLGFFPGYVRRLAITGPEIKLPHIGWNTLQVTKEADLLADAITETDHFYYVHSYGYQSEDGDEVLATSSFGQSVNAVLQVDRVFGTQFHPEKSQKPGYQILRNFLTQC